MEECSKCYSQETKVLLFDAISPEGLVKICGNCASLEGIPLIHSSSSNGEERQQTVRERLSKISGVYIDKNISFKVKEKSELKDLIDKNYVFREDKELKKELIHHERYETRSAARSSIFEYIEVFYNRERLHSTLGYQSPEQFEQSA